MSSFVQDPGYFTKITVTGSANTDNDIVGFSASVTALGATSAAATEALAPLRATLLKTARDLMAMCKGRKESLRTRPSVRPKFEHNRITGETTRKGMEAIFSLTFECTDLDKAGEVYDVLAAVEGVQGVSAYFRIDESRFQTLNKRCFKDAVAKRDDQLRSECEDLGVDPAGLVLQSYGDPSEGRYGGGPVRAMAAMAPEAPSGGRASTELIPGETKVERTLEFVYYRKQAELSIEDL